MESSCPHLGADLSHAEIEDFYDEGEDDFDAAPEKVAVCPWHRYDFNLRTGESEASGLKACTYNVDIRGDAVWVETPDQEKGEEWEVITLRGVSEEFADPPLHLTDTAVDPIAPEEDEPVTPSSFEGKITSLTDWAVLILSTASPPLKVSRTRHACHLLASGQLTMPTDQTSSVFPQIPEVPPVPPRISGTVEENTQGKGKAGNVKNRARMLHALANIELWAIDLAWDIIARAPSLHPSLPHQFYTSFTQVASDEAKHFSLLSSLLSSPSLPYSTPFGCLSVHSTLWEAATKTRESLKARLAIVHLVHEARGLDVNPGTIEKFRRAGVGKGVMGTEREVEVLETIHADEVTHVMAGHQWFTWLCAQEGSDPVQEFRKEVLAHFSKGLKGPFNVEDRRRAGLGKEFYEGLVMEGGGDAKVEVAYGL